MSWYIQTLLINKYKIKESIYIEKNGKYDLDSDIYNDLLIVERKIEELYRANLLSDFELKIINSISLETPYRKIGEELNCSVSLIRITFRQTCEKISFSIGGVFTDDGYLNYLIKKYRLTSQDAKKIDEIMISNRRI